MKKDRVEEICLFLRDNNYIIPGDLIDSEILISLIGEKDTESLKYIEPIILICREIERLTGLFCKLYLDNIKVFTPDESAFIGKKRIEKAQRINHQTAKTMSKTNTDEISDNEKRLKHYHQLNLLNTLNRQSKLILSVTKYYEVE